MPILFMPLRYPIRAPPSSRSGSAFRPATAADRPKRHVVLTVWYLTQPTGYRYGLHSRRHPSPPTNFARPDALHAGNAITMTPPANPRWW